MRSSRRLALTILACGACLAAAPRPASAEWHISPFLGVTFAGKTTFIDPQIATGKKHTNFGGAVTLLGGGILGAEAIVAITPGFFETARTPLETSVARVEIASSRTFAVMGNAVVSTPRRWTEYGLRPFLSGGFGLLHVAQTPQIEDRGFPIDTGVAGFNLGGGAIGFLTRRTGVRFDLRYYGTLTGTDRGNVAIGLARLHYMSASIGLVIRR